MNGGLSVPAGRVQAWAFARAVHSAYWEVDAGGDPSLYRALAAALSARSPATRERS